MGSSLIFVCLMTASVSLSSVTGNKQEPDSESNIKTQTPTGETNRPGHMEAIIGGVVGGVAFILSVVVVVLVVRHKFPGTRVCCAAGGSSEPRINTQHNTEENRGDPNYAEIQIQDQQACSRDALSTVYANANAPADQLFYASVNFQSESGNVGNALPGTDGNGSSDCDYSSIGAIQGAIHPPAAEQTIYTTVTKRGQP